MNQDWNLLSLQIIRQQPCGLQASREIARRYNPRSQPRSLAQLQGIMQFDLGQEPSGVTDRVATFERRFAEHEVSSGARFCWSELPRGRGQKRRSKSKIETISQRTAVWRPAPTGLHLDLARGDVDDIHSNRRSKYSSWLFCTLCTVENDERVELLVDTGATVHMRETGAPLKHNGCCNVDCWS